MTLPTDVADLAAIAAAQSPERLALVESGGRKLTWRELDEQVSRVAAGLSAFGVVGGHRVALVLGNRIEFVAVHLGALRAHAVSVPLNPRSSVADLAWMIADSGARVVVADTASADAVRAAVALVRKVAAGEQAAEWLQDDPEVARRVRDPHVVLVGTEPEPGEHAYAELVAAEPVPVPALPETERLAALLYTSTPSGRPRAAMLTHRALLANIEQVAQVQPATMHGDDVVLAVLPLFHVYALNAVLGSALRHRARLVLVEGFHPETVLDVIDDEAVSVLPLAPPVFEQWLSSPALLERLGPVRLVLSGSASLDPVVAQRFTERTGLVIHQGYGLTEGAPVVTSTVGSQRAQPGSFGPPLPGIEIEIVDDVTGQFEGEDPGHVRLRGENLFSGYWPDGADGPGPDGWWATGDVGWLDDAGELHLVDRVRDVVVVSGFAVYPSEVEEVLGAVSGVQACAVIAADDPDTGEAVVAYVVLEPGASTRDVLAAMDVRAQGSLARFKRPSRVEVVDALPGAGPGSGAGGVARAQLRGLERRRALGLLG